MKFDKVKEIRWYDKREYHTGPERHIYRARLVDESPEDDALDFVAFAAWISQILAAIPQEFRQSARIVLGSDDSESYGYRANFDIYIEREESDAEYAARRAKEEAEEMGKRHAQEQQERAALAALKRKYGE